jgi:NAD(P)-dependent dehydrogenase (short-subunit alcohol dehydrogenase family)
MRLQGKVVLVTGAASGIGASYVTGAELVIDGGYLAQ